MSEYQYIAFRAIDAPVSDENMKFMERQSSRANITSWGFENEYHYGSFRGDAFEMMRRGYDFGFRYANYGIRTLYIRLPSGLPDPVAMDVYLDGEGVLFKKDADGPGGTLQIDTPEADAGTYEQLWELPEMFARLLPLRAEILNGDLRPLYLSWLAQYHWGDDEPATPIPAGLANLSAAQQAMTDLYEMSASSIAAAARESPPMPQADSGDGPIAQWIAQQSEATKDAWLTRLLADSSAPIRAEMMKAFRSATKLPSWPTALPRRPIKELVANEEAAAEAAHAKAKAEAAAAAAKARAKFLSAIAADPDASLRQIEPLVLEKNRPAYEKIARLLVDLRDALADSPKAGLALEHAKRLRSKYPSRSALLGELRKHNLFDKR